MTAERVFRRKKRRGSAEEPPADRPVTRAERSDGAPKVFKRKSKPGDNPPRTVAPSAPPKPPKRDNLPPLDSAAAPDAPKAGAKTPASGDALKRLAEDLEEDARGSTPSAPAAPEPSADEATPTARALARRAEAARTATTDLPEEAPQSGPRHGPRTPTPAAAEETEAEAEVSPPEPAEQQAGPGQTPPEDKPAPEAAETPTPTEGPTEQIPAADRTVRRAPSPASEDADKPETQAKQPGAPADRDMPPPAVQDAETEAVAEAADETSQPAPPKAPEPEDTAQQALRSSSKLNWSRLDPVIVDKNVLNKHRVITATRYDPAHAAFDVLRTRILQAMADRGWTRIAITSPTKGCGKTFTAANLAISLSRQENCPTILFDADLRNPSLAKTFGVSAPGAIAKLFRGETPATSHLLRLGPNDFHAGQNLAFAFNDTKEPYASELLQDPQTAETLRQIERDFAPKLMLFDMPPALYGDDVLAIRPLIDAVVLVVGGGLTTANEIREVESSLGPDTPLLGVVMNRAEGSRSREYGY